ncbi:MAG: GNAT family N-acetyltransferase [Nitrososphaera sp.]|jgi:GNAT superfamily N-acetyltransferase
MRIRAAKRQDKRQVLAFCRDTFSWGDYIDRVWDMWFSDRSGRLLVAEHKSSKVAVSHVSICPGKTAWLEGVRVRPDFRRSGVASALLQEMLAYAGRHKAGQASAIVAADNVASRRMLERAGLAVVSRWAYYSTGAKVGLLRKSPARLATPADMQEAWRYLQQSPIYEQSAKCYMKAWQWYPLDLPALRRLIMEKCVAVTGSPIDGLAVLNRAGYWDRKDVLQIVYLDSGSASARDLVSFAANLFYVKNKFSQLHILCNEDRQMDSAIKKFRIPCSERFLLYRKTIEG